VEQMAVDREKILHLTISTIILILIDSLVLASHQRIL
jgi:hypothetical protein